MKRIVTLLVLVLLALSSSSCCKKEPPTRQEPARTLTPPQSTATRGRLGTMLRVSGEGGKHVVSLRTRRGGGYEMLAANGQVSGKVKVQNDRVKVLDAGGKLIAKVKRKDYGFKVYGGDGSYRFKAKWKGSKLVFKDKDGGTVATLRKSSGDVGGTPIEVKTAGTTLEVLRGGKMVATVHQVIDTRAAAVFGLTQELTPSERAAVAVYLLKIGR